MGSFISRLNIISREYKTEGIALSFLSMSPPGTMHIHCDSTCNLFNTTIFALEC